MFSNLLTEIFAASHSEASLESEFFTSVKLSLFRESGCSQGPAIFSSKSADGKLLSRTHFTTEIASSQDDYFRKPGIWQIRRSCTGDDATKPCSSSYK
jgi:hypothetical protein